MPRPPPWWGEGLFPPPLALNHHPKLRMKSWRLMVVVLTLLVTTLPQLSRAQQQNIETKEFVITEELQVGSSIGFIDTRPGFTYTFNQAVSEFRIDPVSGEIRTAARIDREAVGNGGNRFKTVESNGETVYELVVISSSPTYPIQVRIKVLDKNDNAPVFSSSFTQLSFSESSQIGSRLILETASDPDQAENGKIVEYIISSGNEDGKFSLKLSESRGNQNQYLYLETIGKLDTEEKDVYNLNLTAVDGGNPSLKGSTLLSINILDINDNAPVFSESEYKTSLNESSPVGAFVTQVSAMDRDKGENSRISYSILNSGVAKLFRVDTDTGVITTTQPLQCPANICTLTLVASDHGLPKQESEATVVVRLIDANDHSPQISYSYFPDQNAKFATVEENAKAGSLVAAITVTDKDKGENGKTDLGITQGNEFSHFRLDSRGDIHILRVDSQLDRETITEYNLTIVAKDMGIPPRTSTSYLLVKVNDINDHPPVFTNNVYTAVLSEAAPLGSFVAAPLAVDADSGVNSNIYYSIVEGNDLQWFEIQHESGLITTRMVLDRERLEEVTLKVSARDGGTNPKYADTTVDINIQDINDQTPTFPKDEIETSVTEHTRIGTRLVTLTASDKDKGDNGTVRYSIASIIPHTASRASDDLFKLDPITGDLTVNSDLDREVEPNYKLVVVAKDLGTPLARSSTATVIVDIGDINDNDPVLYPNEYHVVLNQADFQQGELVVQLRAQDPDFGANAEISYEIMAGNDGAFRLDNTNGQVFLNQPIRELSQDVYTLKVSARDGKGRKSIEQATVEILIDNGNIDYYSCTEDLYSFMVQEDNGLAAGKAQVGRQVGVVRVSDPTNSIPDARYSITDGNELEVFSISVTTGVIITKNVIDRELKEKYTLKVNVKSDLRLINAVCIAEVIISDVNDNTPYVLNPKELLVAEDAPIGEVITVLNVEDLDKGENAEHKFKLITKNRFFAVNENTGAVVVTQPLEESRSSKINLQFEISDLGTNQLKTNFDLTISIEDINDHTPYFDQDIYELSVPEDTLVNSKLFLLKATDADKGVNGQVSYDITVGNNRTFGIFPDGNVYLKMKLDREENDYYTLTVRAKDNGTPERSSTVSLTVHIDDINDNSPHFVNSKYQFSVGENEGDKTFIGKIHATDADMGRNAELSYYMEDSRQNKFFSVEPRTGFIFTKQSLDREQLFDDLGTDSISFEVLVSDNGLPVKNQDSATVTVQVFDENDNTPKFASKDYFARVSENLNIGSEVISVFAADPDLNDNGKVKYTIERGDRNNVFKIDSTSGIITLAKLLDRETEDTYSLLVSAEDHGQPMSRSSSVSVHIIIMDENDNRPKILNDDLVLTLAEDIHVGQEVYTFFAEDKDIGENSDVRFSLGDGSYNRFFRLDSLSGSLYLQQPLDYEKDAVFTLKIAATDQGTPSLSDNVELKIRVTDVNDNAPQFPNTAIVRQIQEGISINTPILTMEASDADSGDNGQVRYSLAGYKAGASQKFAIDPLTGVVRTIGDIDREEVDTYEFTVVATDLAEPKSARLRTEKVVTIIVEDVNDNSPEFDAVPTGKLTRSIQTGQIIVTVQASDLDANSNGRVTYKLQQDSFLFAIDHFSGEISLQNRPDKLEPVYQLIVIASDEAVQSARKSATATVTVLGLQTEVQGRGFVERDYVARIEEERGPNDKVVALELRGGNTGARFYIMNTKTEGGSSRNIFRISENGEIYSSVNIDREVHGDKFEVDVLAVHQDNTISTSKVTVYVDDLNDTAPKFLNPPHIKISENTLPGEVVYTLDAFDADSNSILKYTIVSNDDGDDVGDDVDERGEDIFDLEENTGALKLKVNVDREVREEYSITVRVSDGLQFADINLIVLVEDENDNIPEFTSSIYSFELSETSPKGTLVGKVAASDADLGLNSEVDYQLITEWGKDVFSLNPSTGVFTLTSDLDYERNEHYIFVVAGQDRGTPQLSSTVTVYINVKDVNDNSPEFSRSTYTTSVLEDVQVGAGILDLEAKDLDSGDNGRILYSIIGDADEVFSVLENGTLVSKQPLDRERQSYYEFVVKAVDGGKSTIGGSGRNSATTTVKLSLEDINDSVPEITSPTNAYVLENQPANTVVMPVTTIDRDTGVNADIEYFITNSDSDAFDIGRLDGILRTRSVLDREERSLYVLTVTVMDMGRPRLSNSAEVRINVVDTNDNTPTFTPRQYSTTLMENATIGQNILETTAFDADSGLNGDIRYTIVSGDKTRDFTIGEHSGVLSVNRKLEFERKNAYQLTIQAEDSGDPVKYDTASVSIYIEDVNDSAPKFLDSPYHVRVVEQNSGKDTIDQQLPRYITRLEATDPDNPPHNVVKYTIKESYGNKFSVNSTTGDIFLHSSLDREIESSYEIQIVAIDTGYPRLSSTGTLSVLVQDVNDHAPEWTQQKFRVKIAENSDGSSTEPLITVKATDKDEANNGLVRYSLEGSDAAKFSIDENGQIYSSWTFDREDKSDYTITLVAEDQGEEVQLESKAELSVEILDVNDNAPVLNNARERIFVSSDTQIGGFVYKLDVFDLDTGSNGRIDYTWTGGLSDRFRLDKETGRITLANQLNNGQSYALSLKLTDRGQPQTLSSQSEITFVSADASNFPAFSEPQVSEISVTENDIEANLPQFEANGLNFQTIKYELEAGNTNSAFGMDSNSGKLTQVKPLDFEQNDKLELYISAFSVQDPQYKSYHKLTVNIKNVNDNPPEFDALVYEANITEEAYPPITVVKLTATDKDSNSGIRYTLKKSASMSDLADLFEVDATTGEVITLAKLDRETTDQYDLVVQASDEGAVHTTETLIRVKVEDINDNPPRFTRILSINITEDTPPGTILATVNTIDKDVGVNAIVTYRFSSESEVESAAFKIDENTGDITLVAELDRELQDEYFLKVVATDGAWRAETTVGITVQDVNDNTPEFDDDSYIFRVPATTNNYALIGRVIATDKDIIGPNSQVIYRLRETLETFSIDSTSGEILTRQQLPNHDATKTSTVENEYLLEVVAEDSGQPPLSSTCSVKILVMDENLGAPNFDKTNYTAAIPVEASVGYDIIKVVAVDNEDVGLNAEVYYYLEDTSDAAYFSINRKTGMIQLKSLIDVRTYEITVIAEDLGVPPQKAVAQVVIMPSGENRFAPKFTVANTQIIVPEDKPLGKTNIQVMATDSDAGINGIVRFAIVGGNENDMFGIDEVTGEIIINKHLDYDKVKGFVLTVEARDLAIKTKRSNSTLAINLTDVNDNVPFFELPKYHAYIQENKPRSTSIITMKAVDFDSPRYATVLYTIQEPEMSRHFAINEATGEITAARAFDYETENEYMMHVTARNPDSSNYKITQLTIHITGSNEYYPRFQQPVFQFSVSESALPDSVVGQVKAFDQDAGPEGEIFYFLVGPSNDYGFYIEKDTGVIFIKEILDREFQNRFVLTVLAKNSGNIYGNDTDEAQVIIQVQDGNDPPIFRSKVYNAELLENAGLGEVVTTVSAVDRDVRPRNSQFSYSILNGNTDDAFEIDPNIGTIRTIKELDREITDTYQIKVAAIDNGNPPQTGTAMVNIQLKDVNDNPPTLEKFDQRGSLKENSPENTLVAKLQPSDADLSPNGGPFKFRLVGGKHQDWFTIDPNTGDIRSTVSVDREINPELEILVKISDNGSPFPLSATYPIIIDILDENDNPSEPRIMTVLVQTLNGDFPGGAVAPVRPKDPDTTGNYDCKIKSGPTNLFQMKPDCYLHTGRLMNVNNYNLTVIGNDGVHETVTSQVYLTFDKFDQSVQENSLAIRIDTYLETEKLGSLFWHLSSLSSSQGKVQVLSVDQQQNFTDFYVSLRSRRAYASKNDLTSLLKSELRIKDVLPGLVTADIGYSPCMDNPCLNQGQCKDYIDIEDETIIVETENVILNAPKFGQKFTCSCPEKFEGRSCELDVDPCQPNPCQGGVQCVQFGYDYECQCPALTQGKNCQLTKSSSCDQNPCLNGGTCRESNLGGSFFCLCRPGYQGNVCEEPLDPCQPNPCKNGGECVSKKPNYKCKCPDNFYGTNCEKSTFGFSELSFMKFPALDSNTNDIEITFSSMKEDSLLVYNFGQQSGGRSDFIAIELVAGKAVFSFGGARTAITKITVDKYLANGRWHKVTATRNNRVASLSVSDCAESGEFCKLCKAGDETCFAKDIGESGTLNFNTNALYFGGIDDVQEIVSRVGQVASDDFIGCFKSLSINGQPLNLKSGYTDARGILASCPIPGSLCSRHNCKLGKCMEVNWKPVCVCESGVIAANCESSLSAIALESNGTVTIKPTELHKRQQLFLHHKSNNNNVQDLGFRFRTENSEGRIFYAESKRNTEFTSVYIREGRVVYETRKNSFPQINVTSSVEVTDGAWHFIRLVQERSTLKLFLDSDQLGYDLEADSTHNFLDPYLNKISFGGKQNFGEGSFRGCLDNFTINNYVQSLGEDSSTNQLFADGSYTGTVNFDCVPGFLSVTAGSDPVNVGVVIVIVFFIILILAILGSFFAFKLKKNKMKDGVRLDHSGGVPGGNTSLHQLIDNKQNYQQGGGHHNQGYASNTFNRVKKMPTQKPDIIERQIVNDSPLGRGGGYTPTPRGEMSTIGDGNYSSASMAGGGLQDSEQPEHYDIENASSIAPSDIDIIYHYKDYRDGGRHARELNMSGWGKFSPSGGGQGKNTNSPIRLNALGGGVGGQSGGGKLQSTPLARLSPSSDLSHQTPRILTLQDISGKAHPSALLQHQQSSHSPLTTSALNNLSNTGASPHHLPHHKPNHHHHNSLTDNDSSDDNISDLNSSRRGHRHQRRKKAPRDGRTSSSDNGRTSANNIGGSNLKHSNKFKDLLDTNTELLDAGDSSDSPSDNDSFTCSEYDYEAPPYSAGGVTGAGNGLTPSSRQPDGGTPGGMVFRKLNGGSSELGSGVDRMASAGDLPGGWTGGLDRDQAGSLSTLNVSDDDLSGITSPSGPASWETLLNWNPNFTSFVGVFKDIAELPDSNYSNCDIRPSPLGDAMIAEGEDEEYI